MIFFKTQIIENGGWHFSFLKTPEEIAKKMLSYGHGELENLANIENIKNSIKAKRFFIQPDKILKNVSIDETYPEYIRKNKKIFSDWIFE